MSHFSPQFESDFFGPSGAERFAAVISDSTDIYRYLTVTKVAAARGNLANVALMFAEIVEPLDRSAGFLDKEMGAGNTFFNGATFALGALRLVSTPEQRERIAKVPVQLHVPPHVDDDQQIRHLQAARIMDMGHEGFSNYAQAYHGVFEQYERGISSEVRFDIHAQAGFGSIFYLVHEAVEKDKIDDLARHAEMPISEDGEDGCDKAIRQMLGA